MDPFANELRELCKAASGTGLTETQRARWRELTAELLGRIREQHPEISERRQQLRAPLELEVHILAPEELASIATSTVGAGGLGFTIAEEVPVGTIIEMSITVPGRPAPMRAKGQVAHSRKGHLGVAFIDLFQNEREHLEALAVQALLG